MVNHITKTENAKVAKFEVRSHAYGGKVSDTGELAMILDCFCEHFQTIKNPSLSDLFAYLVKGTTETAIPVRRWLRNNKGMGCAETKRIVTSSLVTKEGNDDQIISSIELVATPHMQWTRHLRIKYFPTTEEIVITLDMTSRPSSHMAEMVLEELSRARLKRLEVDAYYAK